MEVETKQIMITNTNVNSMLKPNNNPGQYTTSVGQYTDSGIIVKEGRLNHQTAMIFDVVYDRIYRMLNQVPNSDDYVSTTLNGNHEDDIKLLNQKKLEFYEKIIKLLKYAKDNSILYNTTLKKDLFYAPKDLIDNAFPMDFSLRYRDELENRVESMGNFDEIINLFKTYNLNKYFFEYLLNVIFYGKIPSWENFRLRINLNSIFENKERSIYALKQWFLDSTDILLSMTYPITCFSGARSDFRSRVSRMFPIESMNPFINVEYDKSTTEISISLRNQFMALFAHDAKMCIHKFMPTKLYKMNSNAFFLGKHFLNNIYYDSRKKIYRSKLNYKIDDLFGMLNLPLKDINNSNNTYRRKSINKAIVMLNDNHIINVSKLNSERLILNGVWNINNNKCVQPI